jgi:K+-transporting ATPase c subunit
VNDVLYVRALVHEHTDGLLQVISVEERVNVLLLNLPLDGRRGN